jgi:hypothetical protein
MAWGGHGLPEVSLEPAMPYPSTPSGWPPARWAACCRLLPSLATHDVGLCWHSFAGGMLSICLLRLIAGENERVKVTVKKLDLFVPGDDQVDGL